MGRGALSFKHSDIVRAVRAAQAAGLPIVRTEIHPDGRIVLHHQLAKDDREEQEETYEEWKSRTGNGSMSAPPSSASPADASERLRRKLERLRHDQDEASRIAREAKRKARDEHAIDPSAPLPEVFTPSTLAAHWGCSSAKIRRLVRSGDLPGFMLGSRLLRIRAQEVLAYEAKIKADPSGPMASAPAPDPEKRTRAQRLDVQRPGWR